jgi:hypothetical protein
MNGNNRHLSKTILNVNGLNAPMKRYRTANWVKKQDSTIGFQTNGHHRHTGVAILISDKVNFRLKSVRRDNEVHFILMKGTIHQVETAILSIYAPNIR